jgi:hypothetical protein
MKTKTSHTAGAKKTAARKQARATACNIQYQPHEERYVAKLSELALHLSQGRFDIGKLTDELIEQSGGIKHGDATLARIAQHPKMCCTERQLRRYLGYYLVSSKYGKDLEAKYPKLPDSAIYQLARIRNAKLPPDQEKGWISAVAGEFTANAMTVEQLSQLVSRRLDELGKLSKSKTPKPEPPADRQNGDNALPHVGPEVFTSFTDVLEHIAKGDHGDQIGRTDLRCGVIKTLRLLMVIVDGFRKLGADEELAVTLEAVGKRLLEAAAALRKESCEELVPTPSAATVTGVAGQHPEASPATDTMAETEPPRRRSTKKGHRGGHEKQPTISVTEPVLA